MCYFAINNACNARCGFCNFSLDALPRDRWQFVDRDGAFDAIDILQRNGIRYLIIFGGEPTLHPHVAEIVSKARSVGLTVLLITHGAHLKPARVHELADAGVSARDLQSWVEAGGILVGLMTAGLDELFGIDGAEPAATEPFTIAAWMSLDGRDEAARLGDDRFPEALGPIIEAALKPLVDAGFLEMAYGGIEVGKHLTDHELVTSIHITGSDRAHDAII